jgi:hypothetical protein
VAAKGSGLGSLSTVRRAAAAAGQPGPRGTTWAIQSLTMWSIVLAIKQLPGPRIGPLLGPSIGRGQRRGSSREQRRD